MRKNISASALIVMMVFCLTACFSPENIKKEMEKRVKESPILQEIDHLCTKEVPIFEGFKLLNWGGWEAKNPFLYYTYQCSTAGELKVRGFYKDYFSQHRWQLTKDQIVGPQWILKFRRTDHAVSITYHGAGVGGDVYTLHCQKLLVADQDF